MSAQDEGRKPVPRVLLPHQRVSEASKDQEIQRLQNELEQLNVQNDRYQAELRTNRYILESGESKIETLKREHHRLKEEKAEIARDYEQSRIQNEDFLRQSRLPNETVKAYVDRAHENTRKQDLAEINRLKEVYEQLNRLYQVVLQKNKTQGPQTKKAEQRLGKKTRELEAVIEAHALELAAKGT